MLTCVLFSVFLWAGDAQDSVPDSGESFQSCFNSELNMRFWGIVFFNPQDAVHILLESYIMC